MTDKLLERYSALYATKLVAVAPEIERLLHSYLAGVPRIDRIAARAKSPDRFIEKARRAEDGKPKYADPLGQIQDQLGARVVVFYLPDVEVVSCEIEKYFRHIERLEIVPDSEWEFGYFGTHYILSLPSDAVPAGIDREEIPEFFELQIKTLWQHAWSESEHDLGYKPSADLTIEHKRRLAFTSAQAWAADRTFQDLLGQIGQPEASQKPRT